MLGVSKKSIMYEDDELDTNDYILPNESICQTSDIIDRATLRIRRTNSTVTKSLYRLLFEENISKKEEFDMLDRLYQVQARENGLILRNSAKIKLRG